MWTGLLGVESRDHEPTCVKCRGHCIKRDEANTWKRILLEKKGGGCQAGFLFGGIWGGTLFSNSEKNSLV